MVSRIFGIVIIIIVFDFSVFAQSRASATASATIISPLILTHDGTDLNFGDLSVQHSTGGTVILSPDGTRTFGGCVTLPGNIGSVSAAVFGVSGQANHSYSVTLPANCLLTHTNNNDNMIVDHFTSSPSTSNGAGILNSNGMQTLYVGATLNVAANQTAGLYTSGTAFTVIINYN